MRSSMDLRLLGGVLNGWSKRQDGTGLDEQRNLVDGRIGRDGGAANHGLARPEIHPRGTRRKVDLAGLGPHFHHLLFGVEIRCPPVELSLDRTRRRVLDLHDQIVGMARLKLQGLRVALQGVIEKEGQFLPVQEQAPGAEALDLELVRAGLVGTSFPSQRIEKVLSVA